MWKEIDMKLANCRTWTAFLVLALAVFVAAPAFAATDSNCATTFDFIDEPRYYRQHDSYQQLFKMICDILYGRVLLHCGLLIKRLP